MLVFIGFCFVYILVICMISYLRRGFSILVIVFVVLIYSDLRVMVFNIRFGE